MTTLDPERQKQAKQYARIRRRLWLVDAALSAAFPALALIFSMYGLVTTPLDNAVSRWRERKADRYALQATGKNEAFASAFTRLANQNLGEVDPEKWVVFMFYSHPPLGERIENAKRFSV